MKKIFDAVRKTFLKKIKIGKLIIKGNLFLAPIAGYSDAAFRSVCIEHGASFTFTEMVSAEALLRKNKKTLDMLIRATNEKYLGIQIFVEHYKSALAAVKEILNYNPSIIDINCGCSVQKILKAGCGASLLKNPGKIRDIVKALCETYSVPVSVKLRSGWDSNSLNYLKTAQLAAQAGAVMITLHPRTCTQGFQGKAAWEHIKDLKEQIIRPVIGSGDLYSPTSALQMLHQTGCDGVMFARGAIGNPYIFKQTVSLLKKGNKGKPITSKQRLNTALKQLKLSILHKGEKKACQEMRKHFYAYTKGITHSSFLRKKINSAQTYKEYQNLVYDFISSQ